MSRRRILFVDDEPQVLDGLRDLLWRQRRLWDVDFAAGGDAALLALSRQPFDVVVADLRMPGMDGATLLERVQQDHPGVARIILSGEAERATMLRALRVADHFLGKPCDLSVLMAAIEKVSHRPNQ
jgi:DNA-binding NarL/FixJ family response regulator